MSAEYLLNEAVEAVTLGRFGVQKNPNFELEWQEVLTEKRNLITKIYDSGTLFIIDDQNHRVVPRFTLVRKK